MYKKINGKIIEIQEVDTIDINDVPVKLYIKTEEAEEQIFVNTTLSRIIALQNDIKARETELAIQIKKLEDIKKDIPTVTAEVPIEK